MGEYYHLRTTGSWRSSGPHNAGTDKDLPIHQAMSQDGGRRWSKPQSTGIEGQVCNIESAGDGRVVMVYNRRYHEQPGIMAILSTDEKWPSLGFGSPSDGLGRARGRPRGSGIEGLHDRGYGTWAFGYPGVVRLRDREFLVCFWATEACVTHIRWCRLQLS